jgi:hypothetical protein
LPFNITVPGTYVLVHNLSYSGTAPAITITANLTGPVIVNLKGYALTGVLEVTPIGVSVEGYAPSVSTITIENGTINNFETGVSAIASNAIVGGAWSNFLSGINIRNLVVTGAVNPQDTGAGVFLEAVNNSIISNCSLSGSYGIRDHQSAGGNLYTNITFINCGLPLLAYGLSGNALLEHCQFAPPPSN